MTRPATSTLVDALRTRHDSLAERLVDRQYTLQPDLAARYGDAGRERCLEDAKFHLRMLNESLDAACPECFLDYIAWAKIMLLRRGIAVNDLSQHLGVLHDILRDGPGLSHAEPAMLLVESSLRALPSMPQDVPGFLDERAALADLARSYLDLTLGGQRKVAATVWWPRPKAELRCRPSTWMCSRGASVKSGDCGKPIRSAWPRNTMYPP